MRGTMERTAVRAAKEQLDEKRAEARERYQAFEAERRSIIEGGVDLSKDAAAKRRLDELHEPYKRAADEAAAAEERFFKLLDHSVGAGGQLERLGRIGEEFLKRMGAGGAGLKALDGTSGGTLVPPFFDPDLVGLPQRTLFVRSLISVRQADSDKVWYLRQTVAEQNAAPVAAGAEKPKSVYTVERIEEAVRTIAHVTEALDRALLMDYEELVAFLDNQLTLGVLLAEESQILTGDGLGVNLRGILSTVGIAAVARDVAGGEPQVEAIYRGVVACRAAFHEPDGIVLNPTDWQTIRLAKNANGEYLAAPMIEADPDRLFGIRVITSPVMTQGTGLVGDFANGAVLWDREEARITFTEAGLADAAGTELFTQNQVRFRGEERIAFGVPLPGAFTKVTSL